MYTFSGISKVLENGTLKSWNLKESSSVSVLGSYLWSRECIIVHKIAKTLLKHHLVTAVYAVNGFYMKSRTLSINSVVVLIAVINL